MLLFTIIASALGLAVGAVRGGSLDRLANLRIRVAWLIAGAWLLQLTLFVSPWAEALDTVAAPLHLASIALIGVAIWLNRHLPGLVLIGVGLALNAAVIAANGGFMPVSGPALLALGEDEQAATLREGQRIQKTILMQPDSPLWVLGDVIPVPGVSKVYSVGDLLAVAGVFVLVVAGMGPRANEGGEASVGRDVA